MTCNPLCICDIPARYDQSNCQVTVRKYGFSQFGAIKCSVNFADILDTTAGTSGWATAIAAGDIILGPRGDFQIGDTQTFTIPIDGCGNTIPELSETQWTFTTPAVADDYSDEDWWYWFDKCSKEYTLFYISCEGRVYLNNEVVTDIKASQSGGGGAVAATFPGFQINITSQPKWGAGPNGAGKAGVWTVSGTFTSSGVQRSVEIPGLVDLLASA